MTQTPDSINQHEVRVVGMSRSGNHAIINWILNQVSGCFCFLNCAEPKTNPFLSARPLGNGQVYKTNIPGFDLNNEQQGTFSYKDLLLHSYEDCFLGMINSPQFRDNHDTYVGRSAQCTDVLILRDPFNLFASRMRFYALYGRPPEAVSQKTAIRIWKQHARAYLEPGRYLPNRRVSINYNRWFQDQQYRIRIATALHLSLNTPNIPPVPATAGGSSFDGLTMRDHADDMAVLERWKYYRDDPEYRRIFRDQALVDFAQEIFGSIPGIEQITKR